jgi:uncharacterized small protein (DUF1192 family)
MTSAASADWQPQRRVREARLHEFRLTLIGERPATAVETAIPPGSTKIAVASATSNSVQVREPGNDAMALDDDEPINRVIFDSFADEHRAKPEAVADPPSVQSPEPSSGRITKLKAEIHRLEAELRKLETGKREL